MHVLLNFEDYLEDWENIIHFEIFFASFLKKNTYFLALGTIPKTRFSLIARKITAQGYIESSDLILLSHFHHKLKHLHV